MHAVAAPGAHLGEELDGAGERGGARHEDCARRRLDQRPHRLSALRVHALQGSGRADGGHRQIRMEDGGWRKMKEARTGSAHCSCAPPPAAGPHLQVVALVGNHGAELNRRRRRQLLDHLERHDQHPAQQWRAGRVAGSEPAAAATASRGSSLGVSTETAAVQAGSMLNAAANQRRRTSRESCRPLHRASAACSAGAQHGPGRRS